MGKTFIADKETLDEVLNTVKSGSETLSEIESKEDSIKASISALSGKVTTVSKNVESISQAIGESVGGAALIKISTETTSFIGEKVTLTGADGSKEAFFDDNGECSFRVIYVGDYTAECCGYETAISVGTVSAIYETTLDEHYATVTVHTSSDEFLLKSVSCINKSSGATVNEETFNVGKTATFHFTEAGTYYFQVEYEEDTYKSKDVVITAEDIENDETFDSKVNYILVYGFVETFATLDPEKRITYCDENENYTPMTMKADGTQDYGDWEDWELLKENLPYMVKKDGTADYQLNPSDYTKKLDGSASDVSNTSYSGGAFSWLKKIYAKETYDSSKTYRKVQFAFANSTADTADFDAYAFKYDEDTELEGLWIPMFYMDENGRTISGTQPVYGKTADAERSLITAFSSRACHFGGPVMNLLRDLAYLLTRSTDIQTHWGEGCMSSYVNSSPLYGVKKNAVVGGEQFYGCSGGATLNKAFHSIVIQSFQQLLRDPMTLLSSGKMLVSKYYSLYSLTGSGYTDTGYTYSTSSGWRYAAKLQPVSGFGSVHQDDGGGSTATGCCDGQYYNNSGVRVGRRLGYCNSGLTGGPGCLDLYYEASYATWSCGVGVLLCPSAGYAPA